MSRPIPSFTLDWRFAGSSEPFLRTMEKGCFEDEILDVTIDSGRGSTSAVTRVSSDSCASQTDPNFDRMATDVLPSTT